MSGFLNVTGFQAPTIAGSFLSLLQAASFRGVPFKVIAASVRKGRKIAVHDYPFRDGGWAEDMGRALRTYSFIGYLIGDIAPAMQLALDAALEAPGPGLLIHPTLGAQMVSVLSAGTAVRRGAGRVIEIALEFIEQGSQSLLTTLVATAVQVVNYAGLFAAASGSDLGAFAGSAALAGASVAAEGVAVVGAFGAAGEVAASDASAIVSVATGLPPPDTFSTYGRYGAGTRTTALAAGSTVAGLVADATAARAAVSTAVATATATVGLFSAANATAVTTDLDAVTEAVRATMNDPADQIRVLSNLAGFGFSDGASSVYGGLGTDQITVRDAIAAACRRAALASLARASAAYQPTSYQDAQTTLANVTAALDVEITAAGDAGEDNTYAALRSLRNAVVQDLTTRSASLPRLVTVTFNQALPALTLAQMLYTDASRSDEIVRDAGAPHPAFLPTTFQVLGAGGAVTTAAAGTSLSTDLGDPLTDDLGDSVDIT